MKISISTTESSLIHISYLVNDQLKSYTLQLQGIESADNFLFLWLIAKSKPIFELMPLDAPSLAINKNLYERHSEPLRAFADVINNTNHFIRNLSELPSRIISSKSTLVFKTDNQRYNNLFGYLSNFYPEHVYTLFEPQNFDGKTRTFIKKPLKYSIPYLVDFLLKNNISTIVSVNLDPLTRYMFDQRINIFAALHYLGVRLIHLQNDPSELVEYGYLLREVASYSTTEFVIHSVLSQSFDSSSSNLIFPSPILQDYSSVWNLLLLKLMLNMMLLLCLIVVLIIQWLIFLPFCRY